MRPDSTPETPETPEREPDPRVPVKFHLPASLIRRLRAAAEEHDRLLSREAERLLRRALESEGVMEMRTQRQVEWQRVANESGGPDGLAAEIDGHKVSIWWDDQGPGDLRGWVYTITDSRGNVQEEQPAKSLAEAKRLVLEWFGDD